MLAYVIVWKHTTPKRNWLEGTELNLKARQGRSKTAYGDWNWQQISMLYKNATIAQMLHEKAVWVGGFPSSRCKTLSEKHESLNGSFILTLFIKSVFKYTLTMSNLISSHGSNKMFPNFFSFLQNQLNFCCGL